MRRGIVVLAFGAVTCLAGEGGLRAAAQDTAVSETDERLFADDARSAPSPSATVVVHRSGYGLGRRFACSNGVCTSSDGSLDQVTYVAAAPAHWELRSAEGVTTWFNAGGSDGLDGAISKRFNGRGDGWTVTYTTSGALAGYASYVQDHLGRRMNFEWTQIPFTSRYRLSSIKDAAGTTLATFSYSVAGLLGGATSASGVETYQYYSPSQDNYRPLLTAIVQNSQPAISVTYDAQTGDGTLGRGVAVAGPSGNYRLRYRSASDPRNACANPSIATQVVDRSTVAVCESDCAHIHTHTRGSGCSAWTECDGSGYCACIVACHAGTMGCNAVARTHRGACP